MKSKEALLDIVKMIKKPENKKLVIGLVCCSTLIGVFFGIVIGGSDRSDSSQTYEVNVKKSKKITMWTCSMHPQIREKKAGKCPLCGMDLIPVESGDDETEGSYSVKLSNEAIKLAEVQTTLVKRELLKTEIRVVGKIDFDETRQANITAWFSGRIERMYVDYTGVKVNKGDHMVQIYSPEILATQEELLQAIKTAKNISKSNYSGIRGLTKDTIEDVRSKLRLWGFSRKQIARIEKRKKTSDKMTVYAPIGGVVTNKHVKEGMYVKTGSRIYSIADLTHLWVKLDVYESDIEFIRFGQGIEFYTESLPGQVFKGKISFIDPVLNPKTQTIKIRVNVENKDGKLRPGMFVHAKIFSKISTKGVVIDESLKGKFICPMHPEVIKKNRGKCSVCGMNLVPTKTLGYIDGQHDHTPPLVIPVSAPLRTGERAVVYISLGDGKYVGREVTLGHRVGSHFVVLNGLKEGELVVTHGNFKIDSSAQLMGKFSMMSLDGESHIHEKITDDKKTTKIPRVSEKFKKQLNFVIISYYSIHKALTEDNFDVIAGRSKLFLQQMSKMDMSLLKGKAHVKWMELENEMRDGAEKILQSKDIKKVREIFKKLSDTLIKTINYFGISGKGKTNIFFCPMVGAYWLQESDSTLNPYYGQSMLTCGEKKQ
jgi:Cu(I)/Ag(I) efflux system membrane fusion protein